LLFIFGMGTKLSAQQQNLPQYDIKRKLHFGFTLGLTSNDFKIRTGKDFLNVDTLQSIGVKRFPGFLLGGIMDYRFTDKFTFRILPSIAFAQRNLVYKFTNSVSNREVKIESVYIEIPMLFKYRTKRFTNYRFYTIGGFKYSYDLASNIDANRSLSDPVVALYPNTFSYELGFGFDIYFPYFKFSPELKITNGIKSALVKDGFVYTESLNGLWSRIVNFSFHFE
jgi:hypothetical protein